jgi:hypothetical protein
MAKKKVVTSDSSRKSKKSGTKRSSKSEPVQTGQQRSLTSDEIGHVAGEVWQLLTDENNRSLASIKKSIDAPDVLILAAIGWLAREDKLQFDTSGRFTNVLLR